MKRSSPLAPARRKVHPKVPEAVRAEVKRRTHGLCFLCLWRMDLEPTSTVDARTAQRGGARRIVHLHHAFPRQKWPDLAAEVWNVLGMCEPCHFGHEYPGVRDTRIPRDALPSETIALADGDGPRLNYLERTYPLAGAGRNPACMGGP